MNPQILSAVAVRSYVGLLNLSKSEQILLSQPTKHTLSLKFTECRKTKCQKKAILSYSQLQKIPNCHMVDLPSTESVPSAMPGAPTEAGVAAVGGAASPAGASTGL